MPSECCSRWFSWQAYRFLKFNTMKSMHFQSTGSGFFWNSTYPPDYYSVTNHQTVIITFTDVKTSHSYSASSLARDSMRPYLKAEPNINSWNHIHLKKETNPFTKCSGFHKKQLMTKKVQKNSLSSCVTPLSENTELQKFMDSSVRYD